MELVASAFLNPVCERVINAALEEYRLVRDFKKEIQKLQSTVSLIKGVLRDAEEKQVKEEAVRAWLGSLKQALFDAEDILDEAATDAILQTRDADGSRSVIGMKRKVRNIICCFGRVDKILSSHGIAQQIKAIRLRLDDINKEKDGLGLQISSNWPVECTPRRPHTSSLFADESYLIGRDEEKNSMIQLLLASEEEIEQTSSKNNVRTLAIVGMGGVGKTTLAKLVFNDSKVKQHFELMMWVCVSEDFDIERIAREIVDVAFTYSERKELSEISNWNLHQQTIKEKIESKRFLLVLDDVWEEDGSKWETLCEPLMSGRKGSKIIVTTRNQRTLNMVKGIPISLKIMSSEDLWPIFERYAFDGCDSSKNMQLETVGRQIVTKLGGLPLAAKTIGRLLNERLDVNRWKDILGSEIFKSQQYADGILPILKWSYDHLSEILKQCFAYCSLFPKDKIFLKDEMIQLWMAQNFIQNTRDFHAENVGCEILDDLLYKSFFEMPRHLNVEEKLPDEFMMHDLIHDLAEAVSKDDCFRLGDGRCKKISETVRHVCVAANNLDLEMWKELCEHGILRTLVFLRPIRPFSLTPYLDDLCMKLKRLRVLGLKHCWIEELPASICRLKHLRFLDLQYTSIRNLPECFGNLRNLQVLKLEGCRLLGALPSNTSALVNLRHLEVDAEVVSNVQGLGKLTALQELNVSGRKVRELTEMGMLKQLRIQRLEEVESKEEAVQARLETKEHLDVLELEWGDCSPHRWVLDEEVLDGMHPISSIRHLVVRWYAGAKSPRWMEDPLWVSTSFLEKVKLDNCANWEALPPLGQLHCLKSLKISRMSRVRLIGPQFLGCREDAGGVRVPGFPSLEKLEFVDMRMWEEWEAPHEDDCGGGCQPPQPQPLFLPQLRILRIIDCPKLRELPPLLPTSLEKVRISGGALTHLPGWLGGNFDGTVHTSSSIPSLSSLCIEDCPNLTSLNDGLLQHPLQTLKKLEISRCKELTSLPERRFSHLTSLKLLTMTDCPRLTLPPSLMEGDVDLPSSLEEVEIHGCGDMMAELLLASLQKLTSLSRLVLADVDTMERLPQLTSLTSLRIMGDTHLDDRTLSGCLCGLTSLTYLKISNCSAFTTLPSTEVVCRLTALKRLEMCKCMELRTLGGCHALVSLEEMVIDNCPKLLQLVEEVTSPSLSPPTAMVMRLKRLRIYESTPEQITMWLRQCPSLQTLIIEACPQLTCFDDNNGDNINRELVVALLNLAPYLRSLHLNSCENLRSLPSKLKSLSSLEDMRIYGCPQIQCLPSAGLPASLEQLVIYKCPELKKRCEKEGGPDWPLMSHIPDVIM